MQPIGLPKDYTADAARLLVTAADAARMLAMGKSTFWREVKNKTVPAPVKIGGLTRWRVADLNRFIEAELPAASHVLDHGQSPAISAIDIPARVPAEMSSTFLTPRELAALTGVRATSGGIGKSVQQIRALLQMRVPHYVNPRGDILVPRAGVERGETVPLRPNDSRGVDLSKVK